MGRQGPSPAFGAAAGKADAPAAGAATDSSGHDRDYEEAKPLMVSGDHPVARHVFRRIHWRILPIFFVMAMCCYIDRTNLAFASIQLNKDLGFNTATYGFGSGLFFVGYSAAMIPSQLLLMYVGPPRWLGAIVTAWGIAAMAMAGMNSRGSFYALRLLLGVAESGAFPGMWFYLNSWYPAEQVAFPYSVIEAAVGAANVVAAPLAAGFLMLDGAGGLRGWQWLFLLEGLPSVGVGLAMAQVLPKDAASARWLSSGDASWLAGVLAPGRRHASEAAALGPRRLLGDAVRNPRLWTIAVLGIAKNMAGVGLLFFAPIMVDAIIRNGGDAGSVEDSTGDGLDAVAAAEKAAGVEGEGAAQAAEAGIVLLTAVPFVASAACAVWVGRRAQVRGERCYHVAVPYWLSALLLCLLPSATAHSPAAGFACLTGCIAALNAPTGVLNSLASSVGQGPSQAVSLALYNAVANLGGLLGPWLIGSIVQHTGTYDVAVRVLGMLIGAAGAGVWWMRRWGLN